MSSLYRLLHAGTWLAVAGRWRFFSGDIVSACVGLRRYYFCREMRDGLQKHQHARCTPDAGNTVTAESTEHSFALATLVKPITFVLVGQREGVCSLSVPSSPSDHNNTDTPQPPLFLSLIGGQCYSFFVCLFFKINIFVNSPFVGQRKWQANGNMKSTISCGECFIIMSCRSRYAYGWRPIEKKRARLLTVCVDDLCFCLQGQNERFSSVARTCKYCIVIIYRVLLIFVKKNWFIK